MTINLVLNLPTLKKLLLCLMLNVIFLHFSNAYAANDKTFFWQVTPPQSDESVAIDPATVYLMGSVHFADKSFYPLRKEIEAAYQDSDALVVELDIKKIDYTVYNNLISQLGKFKNGTTIKDVISEETWLQLRQRLRHLNIPYDSIKSYKPGVLVLTLSATQVMKMGFDPELGIDAHFLSKAAEQGKAGSSNEKKIIELESLEQQLNLFLNIPNGELLLKESLYSLDEAELLMAEIVRYWKEGNEAQMTRLLFDDALSKYPAFSAIYERLFYERNRKMTIKIDQMLKQKGSYFVVVGSGHLVGEKGIVEQLKAKGYNVKRL